MASRVNFNPDGNFIDEVICDGCGYAVAEDELCEDCSLCPTCCKCCDFTLEEGEDIYDD